ncbi:putative epoxide hydrolase [Dichotomopilus funicola]|uniref:Epoxide hydrolase n=1 Tax=Dichotomopilus funicola TaxID=1934379 RepID=A0AAN6ZHK8_9PEZI|nr:putative epoxide hydrolase [Dichotomopilus funicola]
MASPSSPSPSPTATADKHAAHTNPALSVPGPGPVPSTSTPTTTVDPAFGILPATTRSTTPNGNGNHKPDPDGPARSTPTPFTLHVPDAELARLNILLEHSVIGPPSYYNTASTEKSSTTGDAKKSFGATREWLANAAHVWTHDFDWRAHERRWNAIPQFMVDVTTTSNTSPDSEQQEQQQKQNFRLHFAALFSRNPAAVPVLFCHGWPSSWLDFVPLLELLAAKYTPETLPYHIVAPSIPDFGLSTRPVSSAAAGSELDVYGAAAALNELMKTLGFDAYVAQGGDVGSGLVAALGGVHDECKAVLFNNFLLTPSEKAGVAHLPVLPQEALTIAINKQFIYSGTGYMLEQGTKPGTISLALMSNPVALLAWIGGLYAEATTFTLPAILQQVAWYWHTQSYGRALWPYRVGWEAILRDAGVERLPSPLAVRDKPVGYSWFPYEALGVAESWLGEWFGEGLVFFRRHEKGGHFAAYEEPAEFLQDVEDFVATVKDKIQVPN